MVSSLRADQLGRAWREVWCECRGQASRLLPRRASEREPLGINAAVAHESAGFRAATARVSGIAQATAILHELGKLRAPA